MYRLLALFLLTRSLADACTGIMLHPKDGSYVHGRTVEFAVAIDTSLAMIPRGQAFTGTTPKGKGLSYTTKYASLGMIAFDNVNILDGINEKGLAVGAFYFPTIASYVQTTPENQSKGLSPVDFPNWILTQFATVEEVRGAIEKEEVVITPTVVKNWGSAPPPFHYIVYDLSGKSIVIEPIAGQLVVYENPWGVITNSPSFDWHFTNIRNYINLRSWNVKPLQVGGYEIEPLGQGSGMVGMPGDFTPPSRFVRAAIFSVTVTPEANAERGILQTFHILNNFDIPVGAIKEKSDGTIETDYTMLTVARDPQSLRYYFRSYEDQTIRMVDLSAFDFDGTAIKTLSTKTSQPIVDMTKNLR